jgi:hypothetical protein
MFDAQSSALRTGCIAASLPRVDGAFMIIRALRAETSPFCAEETARCCSTTTTPHPSCGIAPQGVAVRGAASGPTGPGTCRPAPRAPDSPRGRPRKWRCRCAAGAPQAEGTAGKASTRPPPLERRRRVPGWSWSRAYAMTSPGCSAASLSDVKASAPAQDLLSNRKRSLGERACWSLRDAVSARRRNEACAPSVDLHRHTQSVRFATAPSVAEGEFCGG